MVVGTQTMTNSDFLAEVYGDLSSGHFGWVTNFRSDPNNSPPSAWGGRMYRGTPNQAALIDRAGADNTYFCTAVLRATDDGQFVRRKEAFCRLAALVIDDVNPQDVVGFTWCLQTSPGNHQVGILLDPDDADCANQDLIDRVMSAIAARGRSNDASGNACVRYVRLPVGSNTKPRAAGVWEVSLESWAPKVRWSLEDACAAIGVDLESLRLAAAVGPIKRDTHAGNHAGDMLAMLSAPVQERTYHDTLTRLAASLISGGMFPGAAVELLYSLMDQVKPTGPAEEIRRWESRRTEIPRAVKSAEKFAPENRKPAPITVNLHLRDQATAERSPNDPQPMDWDALNDTPPTPTQWRLDGWLPEGTTTLLSANGGVGKSNLALQLGVSLASGRDFVGQPVKRGRVLIVSGEDEARTVHWRVSNICADANLSLRDLCEDLIVFDLTQADCVLWRDGYATARMQWLADQIVRFEADIIIIDNASDVFADNENDRTAVRGFMRCLNMICSTTQSAILLLAHVDKASVRMGAGLDSNTTFSGSTAWNNSARSRWAMVREDNAVVLRHEKCNLGPLQDELRLEFDAAAKLFKPYGSTPGAQLAAQALRNAQRSAILKLIDNAANAGQNVSLNAKANNNAWRVLRSSPDFPRLERAEFFSLLFQLQRDGLLEEINYVGEHRKTHKRLAITPDGHRRIALSA